MEVVVSAPVPLYAAASARSAPTSCCAAGPPSFWRNSPPAGAASAPNTATRAGPAGSICPAGDWTGRNKRLVRAPFADVLARPEVESPCWTPCPGALAARRGGRGGLAEIALPDGREGYTKCSLWEDDYKTPPAVSEEALRARAVEVALSYQGTQYRWGGKSPGRGLLGADLHGLVLLRGVPLPGRPAGGRLSRAAHPL